MRDQKRYLSGRKNILVATAINTALFLFKLGAGILGRSQAMVADAIHTLSDILVTGVVLVGLRAGTKPQDRAHPYGHGKFETMSTAGLSLVLVGVSFGFLYQAVLGLISFRARVPTILPLVAAAFSIIFKEGLYQYTIRVAQKIKSSSLKADAWHHRSDAFSSIPVFLGILAARLGFPFLDPLAAGIVAIFILWIGLTLGMEAFGELVETSVDEDTLKKIRDIAFSVEGIRRIHDLTARKVGPDLIVEMHILVDSSLSVQKGHLIADTLEHRLKKMMPDILRATIHVDPIGRTT